MQTDIIIVGQGISGTFLSYYLQKAGVSFIVIDEAKPNTASKAAAGLINPVTGRRIVKTWMIDELMSFAKLAYVEIGNELGVDFFSETNIIDFFATPQMRQAFLQRLDEDKEFLELPDDENSWRSHFNYDFGFGKIEPVYLVSIAKLIAAFRKKLLDQNFLLEDYFDIQQLVLSENKVQYKDIIAEKIVFCDGVESFQNPYFKNLPFAPNKGEALLVEIKDIPDDLIYKKGINLVPLGNQLFWVGSSYEWRFQDDQPTEMFRKKTESILLDWLKANFKVIEHFASVRPATLERRPFVGFHPANKNVGILNGMGTKGCSLAPYFASQLVENIVKQKSIDAGADINRFAKILNKQLV
jgi:glycine/D-amino acid oxidase-like deaminating enzyme